MNKSKNEKFYKLYILTPLGLKKYRQALLFMRQNSNPMTHTKNPTNLNDNESRVTHLNNLNEQLMRDLRKTSSATNTLINNLEKNEGKNENQREKPLTSEIGTQQHIITRNKDTQTSNADDDEDFQFALNDVDLAQKLVDERRSSLANFIPEKLYENIPLLTESEKNDPKNTSYDNIDLDEEQKEFIENLREAGIHDNLADLEFRGFDNDKSFVNVNRKGNTSSYMIAKPKAFKKKKKKTPQVTTRQQARELEKTMNQSQKKNLKDSWVSYENIRLKK